MARNLLIGFFLWLLLWALWPVAGLTLMKFAILASLFVIPAWGLIWVCSEILPMQFREAGTALACIFIVPIPGIKLVRIVEPWLDDLIRTAQ